MTPIAIATSPWARVDTYAGSSGVGSTSLHEYWRGCPVCGAHRERVIQEQPHFQFYTDAATPKRMTLRDVQCLDCYALYKNPCYSKLGMEQLFAEAGCSYGHGGQAQTQVDWLQSAGLFDGRSSVLDVGCGSGRFLSLMPESWTRMGIEPDPALTQQCHDSGLTPFASDVDAPWQITARVDLITLWHVLEHVPNPIATLRRLRTLAHDQTRLVVEVPVLELGSTPDVSGFFSPQHVTHFSAQTLSAVLQRSGWAPYSAMQVFGYNGRRVIARPAAAVPTSAPAFADVSALCWYQARQQQHLAAVELKAERVTAQQLVIWGAGSHTETLYQHTTLFRRQPERTYLLVDSDPLKQGKSWRGIPIAAPAEVLSSMDWTDTTLLMSSYGDQEAIAQAALALKVPTSRIVRLYEPRDVRSY